VNFTPERFQIFAHGVEFDPDAYVAVSPLQFDGVWHKGEVISCFPKSSGVYKLLDGGRQLPFDEQEAIATEFIADNRDALTALGNYPGVTTFLLALQMPREIGPGTRGLYVAPSMLLMWHCLDVGLRTCIYVWLNRRPDPDGEPEGDPPVSPDGGSRA
jgi:hypothetical protein